MTFNFFSINCYLTIKLSKSVNWLFSHTWLEIKFSRSLDDNKKTIGISQSFCNETKQRNNFYWHNYRLQNSVVNGYYSHATKLFFFQSKAWNVLCGTMHFSYGSRAIKKKSLRINGIFNYVNSNCKLKWYAFKYNKGSSCIPL